MNSDLYLCISILRRNKIANKAVPPNLFSLSLSLSFNIPINPNHQQIRGIIPLASPYLYFMSVTPSFIIHCHPNETKTTEFNTTKPQHTHAYSPLSLISYNKQTYIQSKNR